MPDAQSDGAIEQIAKAERAQLIWLRTSQAFGRAAAKSPRMEIGTIAALWRYPVKSLAAEALSEVAVDADGLRGDRRSALLVADAGHVRSGKPFRGKEHGLLHTVDTLDAAAQLGASTGVALRAVNGERYFDVEPVSLLWDTWLHDVETLVGRRLDPLRYRANVFVAAASGYAGREHDLVGETLALGDAVHLRVVAPIARCVTTTYDVADGTSDPAVLRAVAQQRANIVGVYCSVLRTGTIAIGDRITRWASAAD